MLLLRVKRKSSLSKLKLIGFTQKVEISKISFNCLRQVKKLMLILPNKSKNSMEPPTAIEKPTLKIRIYLPG